LQIASKTANRKSSSGNIAIFLRQPSTVAGFGLRGRGTLAPAVNLIQVCMPALSGCDCDVLYAILRKRQGKIRFYKKMSWLG